MHQIHWLIFELSYIRAVIHTTQYRQAAVLIKSIKSAVNRDDNIDTELNNQQSRRQIRKLKQTVISIENND